MPPNSNNPGRSKIGSNANNSAAHLRNYEKKVTKAMKAMTKPAKPKKK